MALLAGPVTTVGAADTNLYRSAAAQLKTDGQFRAAQDIVSTGADLWARFGLTAQVKVGDWNGGSVAGLVFGSAADTNLYRSAASQLKTDGEFHVGSHLRLTAAGNQLVFFGDTNLYRGTTDQLRTDDAFYASGAGGFGWTGSAWGVQLNIPTSGITLGADTNLYRAAANRLSTDDSFWAIGDIVANQGSLAGQTWLHPSGGIYFGSAADTNLYRPYADALATNDSFLAGANLYVDTGGTGSKLYFGSAADTNLYRSAADTLQTDDQLILPGAQSGTGPWGLQVGQSAGYLPMYYQGSVGGSVHGYIGHNNYFATDGVWRYGGTHSSFGGRGIMFNYATGIDFYANAGATTAGATFTPTLQFRIGNDGKTYYGAAMDTDLYRSAAATLRTTSSFLASGHIRAMYGSANEIVLGLNSGGTPAPYILFGNAYDTNLFRAQANLLRTDAAFMSGPALPVSDWNNAIRTSTYIGNLATNGPPTTSGYNYWTADCVNWQDDVHCTQLLTNLFVDEMWFRRLASGVFGAWQKVYPAAASGGWTRIADVALVADAGNIQFTSIPQTYKALRLLGRVRASASDRMILTRFNNDNGSNYADTRGQSVVDIYSGYGMTQGSTWYGGTSMWIFDYAQPGPHELIVTGTMNSGNNGNPTGGSWGGAWKNSSQAITSILIWMEGGANLVAGSRFSLWGVS